MVAAGWSPGSLASARLTPLWRDALLLALIGVATFAAFPTKPLYSENQNTKFLYGLAKAGYGRLRDDWLAQQPSELPIFDALVFLTANFAGPWAFFVWHALLVVVYAVAMYGIARLVGLTEPERFGPGGRWFLTIFGIWFVGLHSNNATGRMFEGVGHQYIHGPVFEPAMFGVLALLGLLLFRLGQAGWAAVLIVAAAWIHPAYAIPGLMLFAGMVVARWRFGPAMVQLPPLVMAGGVLGCLGAAGFAWSLLQPVDPAVHAEAVRIITEIRIPQHSLPEQWFDGNGQAKLLLVITAIVLARRDPVGWVLLTMTLGIAALSIWVYVAHDMQLALAAPWRASAIVMPAANAILLGRAMQEFAIMSENRSWLARTCLILTAFVLVAAIGLGIRGKIRQFVLLAKDPAYFAWVRDNAKPGDVFLTPVHEMDFRLATGQPQYVSWKSHPYAGPAVLEWYRRVEQARAVTKTPDPPCETLAALAGEGVTHVVRKVVDGAPDCPGWDVVYADGTDVIAAHSPE
jgi:hypothetical protein